MGDETKQPSSPALEAEPPRGGAAQPTGNEAPPAPEIMPGLEALLRQAELQAAEHHDAWLRAKAETDNVRKRAEIEVDNARKYAVERFSAELLPVKDALEAALAVENASSESMKGGVELTLKQLNAAFEKFKLTEVNPLGEKFDPHKHQAISMVESDAAPNTVITVLQKGYLLQERTLRPALVIVAKAKTETSQNDASSA